MSAVCTRETSLFRFKHAKIVNISRRYLLKFGEFNEKGNQQLKAFPIES